MFGRYEALFIKFSITIVGNTIVSCHTNRISLKFPKVFTAIWNLIIRDSI